MIAVLTFLFVLIFSIVVIRVATVGLTLTGLSKDLAHFQALSAFTGSGYTTRESEDIVNHPVRRRIVMHLMLLGNAGIVIVIATVLKAFLGPGEGSGLWTSLTFRLSVMLVGIVLLWFVSSSQPVERVMWQVNSWIFNRWTHLDVRDYTGLLRLAHDYAVWELRVQQGDWLAGRSLADLQLANEGVLVLGIERGEGKYLGAPRGDSRVSAGDSLLLYGRQETLMSLDTRRAGVEGNFDHVIAVTRQLDVEEQEQENLDGEQDQTGP